MISQPGEPIDEHSYAELDRVRTTRLSLDLSVDFDQRQIAGTATLYLEWLDPAATRLSLDTRDLDIERVEGSPDGDDWQPLSFTLAEEADPVLGSRLDVEATNRPTAVRVGYRSSPRASGLQWLEPAMTEGGRAPFMFSQSQQIHARSWVPLQDTPSVRFTYDARVTAPAAATVLMSADNDPSAGRTGCYTFEMPQAIPSYLLAIACGDLAFAPVSARCGVWAEPAMVERAAAELEDLEGMLEAAEGLYGPYRWDRYDVLVLPPSFPYGGMENPRLTFATPTVIVGDKSLVSLVAHEIAHSWSGNLVTFTNARHTWLNESVTTYVERRVVEVLSGKGVREMLDVIDRDELAEDYRGVTPVRQILEAPPGTVADPDDLSHATTYFKGAWFLQWLEESFGREDFDDWLRGYFDHFAFQSITTEQFRDWLRVHLVEARPEAATMAEVDEWLHEPGIPATAPVVVSPRLAAVDAARAAWLDGADLPAPETTSGWSTQEWLHFVAGLPEQLSPDQVRQLDAAYHFTGTPNGEIAQRWYPVTVRSGVTDARPELAAFLQRVGRVKLVIPTYRALAQTPDGLAFARQVLTEAAPGYHPITLRAVEKAMTTASSGQQ